MGPRIAPLLRRSARLVAINVLVFVVLAMVIFVVGEIAARVYLQHFADSAQFQRYASLNQLNSRAEELGLSSQFAAQRYVGFIPTPNFEERANKHNSLGYRGDEFPLEKPPGEFRIVCLGGSTTYTSSVNDYRQSYPDQLGAILNDHGFDVRVINGGSVNWTTHETLVNFQFRVLELSPDMIVVYHGVNDLLGRLVWPPSAYRMDNSGLRALSLSQWHMPPIIEYSTFARFFLVRLGVILPHSAGSATLNPLAPTYLGFEMDRQMIADTYPSGLFSEHPIKEILEVNRPTHFRRNMESLVAIADAQGIDTVLATFAFCPGFENHGWSSNSEFTAGYAEMNATTIDVAKNADVALFDFAQKFPQDPEYFSDGIHLNEAGARRKAELFAEFIESTRLLPRNASASE